MRKSKTLAKLRAGEPVRMCAMGHFIPPYIRYAARFGFDCIWLDLEHRAMDAREVQALMAFFRLYDIDCMLRAPSLEKSRLYRYLEDGATGLMIPHVSNASKAQALVQAVKFPPLGDRGLDAAGLDADFNLPDRAGYAAEANRETFLVVQIETPEALNNLDEIASVDGIDGLFLGPGDLQLRLTHERHSRWTLDTAREQMAEVCARRGKPWGQPAGTPELLRALRKQGAQLIPHGDDFTACAQKLKEWSGDFDSLAE